MAEVTCVNTSLSTVFKTLNLICSCGEDIETTSYYPLHCPDYLHERKTPFNTVNCIVPNIFDFNNDQLTESLLYGKEDLDNINNTSILDATINYLIETKRFNAELFWYSPNVMALTLMWHLKLTFLSFFFFVFIIFMFLLFLGCFFIFYLYIFLFPDISQHVYVYLMIVNFLFNQ